MPFIYEAFISYSSTDGVWAKKLFNSLEQRLGRGKVYLDHERLMPGREWPQQLREALNSSRNLVVLQTPAEAPWRFAELTNFDALSMGSTEPRRIVPVLFEGEMPKLFNQLQAIKAERIYQGTPETIAPSDWDNLVQSIITGFGTTNTGKPIRVAVLAATRDEIESVDFARQDPDSNLSLDGILQSTPYRFDKAAILSRYGTRRLDWRPFSGNDSIDKILENLLAKINLTSILTGEAFYWERLDESAFWNSAQFEDVFLEADKLKFGPALIILDPISLAVPLVQNRCLQCVDSMNNKDAAVMAFSPFGYDYFSWCEIIKVKATKFYRNYYEPDFLGGRDLAQLNIHTVHPNEASRLLKYTIHRSLATPSAHRTNPITSMR